MIYGCSYCKSQILGHMNPWKSPYIVNTPFRWFTSSVVEEEKSDAIPSGEPYSSVVCIYQGEHPLDALASACFFSTLLACTTQCR